MPIWYRAGVKGHLIPEAAEGLRRVSRLFDEYDYDLFVNSVRDGIHSQSSFHPHGRAFDIDRLDRNREPTCKKIRKEILEMALGNKWDVVEHNGHFHCELDRLEF